MQSPIFVAGYILQIVMEAISREFRVALPWELYAETVIAETEEELIKRLNEWKENVESKGMRVNMNKTKVMISGERQMVWQKASRWPCGVCNKGVGSNSLQCTRCQKWVHKKCSGTKRSMSKVAKSFICRGCLNPVTTACPQKNEPLNILQQQPQICSNLNKILHTQDDICYKRYYIVSYKSALTLLKNEFLNNITHKS